MQRVESGPLIPPFAAADRVILINLVDLPAGTWRTDQDQPAGCRRWAQTPAPTPAPAPAPSGATTGTERRQERRTGRTERRTERRTGRKERRTKRRGGGEATEKK